MALDWNTQLSDQVAQRLVPALDEIDLRIEGRAKAELWEGHGKKTATLQRSIHSTPARVDGNSVVGAVGTEPLPYAMWVHQGTPAHTIRARGKALRFVIDGHVFFRRFVNHPGTRAIPYLIIGFNEVQPHALDIIEQHIRGQS